MAKSPPPPRREYWDSCVLIHALEGTKEHAKTLGPLMELAENGGLVIVCSTLTIAEVAKIKCPNPMPPIKAESILKFFENDYFEVNDVDRIIAEKANELVRTCSGMHPADAIHLATAIREEVPFRTYETKLCKKKIGSPPHEISKPSADGIQKSLLPKEADQDEHKTISGTDPVSKDGRPDKKTPVRPKAGSDKQDTKSAKKTSKKPTKKSK